MNGTGSKHLYYVLTLTFIFLSAPNPPNLVTLSTINSDNAQLTITIVPNSAGTFTKYRIQLQEMTPPSSSVNSGVEIVRAASDGNTLSIGVVPGRRYQVRVRTESFGGIISTAIKSNEITAGKPLERRW